MRQRVNFAIMGRSLISLGNAMCSGPGAWMRLIVVYVALVVHGLRASTRRARPKRLRLRLGDEDRDWWVSDAMEVAALWEVFVAKEYGDWLPDRAHLVIDAGANVGTATAWFRLKFPEARVIAVEPNPDAIDRLRLNVGGDPKVDIVHAALTDRDGTIGFASPAMTILGSVVDGASSDHAVEVEAVTLDTLRARVAPNVRVDLLKIDTEGSEWQILRSSLEGIKTIVLELHEPVPDGQAPDAALADIARRTGFELRTGQARTIAPEKLHWLLRTPSPEPS